MKNNKENYPLNEHPYLRDFRQLVTMQADCIPDNIAFQYLNQGKIVKITYGQFYQDIEALGTFFYHQQLRNTKIAILGENSYEWILTYFAAVMGSDIIVPLDKDLSNDEIRELLVHCDVQALVHSDSYTDIAGEMLRTRQVQKIYNMDHFAAHIDEGKKLMDSGVHGFEQNIPDENSVCSIIFTSGTTGVSKGVMLSQKNLMTDAVSSCKNVYFSGASLLTLPLHHTFAITAGILVMLIYGVPICISKSLRTFYDDMKIFQPNHMFLVPLFIETMYKNICKSIQEQGIGSDHLTKQHFHSILGQFGGKLEFLVSGGAPIDQKYIEGMESFGIQVLNGYGITECSPVVAVNRNQYYRNGSVGIPLSCCEVKIEDGEICVKGDNIMLGYYHDETTTREVLKDGWFHTGDIGYLDEDGFLYITGRKKNLIILSNGENISAEELENRVQNIENVREVIVYEESGVITAEIYAENQDGIQEGITGLNKELPVYKRIQKVKFRSTEFEKTTTKKIKRTAWSE